MRVHVASMLGILLLGCGGEGEGGGLSELFEALNGRYDVGGGRLPDDCFIEVLGSRVHAVDGSGARLCSSDEPESHMMALVVSATLSDSRLSGSGEYHEFGMSEDLGCTISADRLTSVTAQAEKTMGRSVEGRFAALAGLWTGSVSIERTTEVDSSCADSPMRASDLYTYQFDADIGGRVASIIWNSSEDAGTFAVTEDVAGNLVVDGELVPFAP